MYALPLPQQLGPEPATAAVLNAAAGARPAPPPPAPSAAAAAAEPAPRRLERLLTLPRLGTLASLLIHGATLALVYHWYASRPPLPPEEKPIELVLAPPPPRELVPPPPPPKAETPPPPKAAPPRPQVAAPPKAVAPPPPNAFAEAPATPAPPVAEAAPAERSAPPAPPQPAPAAPARPAQASANAIPSDYVNQVYARINRIAAGRYPKAAALRRQEGRIGYTLQLNPQGGLIGFELEPSGIEALDQAAAEALRAAAPFPPLPELGGGSYRLSGAIVYRLGN